MAEHSIVKPSHLSTVKEDDFHGVYEISGLYPGYGHTLGNSLRRIILSSLPGVAVTSVKIDGVSHEFSVIEGVKEDVVTILLNLKQVRMKVHSGEREILTVHKKGEGVLTAGELGESNSQVEVINTDHPIATLTDSKAEIKMEVTAERGLGYIPKEQLKDEKEEVGSIALDAVFTPIRRVSYEVESMRVGERTDFNKLRVNIETDGTITPRDSLENSIKIMLEQMRAILNISQEEEAQLTAQSEVAEEESEEGLSSESDESEDGSELSEEAQEVLKTRIETLDFSTRTQNVLAAGNIRTVGGLVAKKEADLLELEGMGEKGLEEIKGILEQLGLTLKEQ